MNRLVSSACLAAVAVASPLFVSTAAAAPARSYTATEVATRVLPVGIDDLGDYVVGNGQGDWSLRKRDGSAIGLPYPDGVTSRLDLTVAGISSRGATAGSYDAIITEPGAETFAGFRAVTWTRAGTATALPTPPGRDSSAYDVNDRAVAVGIVGRGTDAKATVWRRNRVVTLGPSDSEARFVNNRGKIVGTVDITGDQRAVVFTGRGTYRPLRDLAGGTTSFVTALSETGALVGTSYVDGRSVPTYWDARERPHRLRGTEYPVGINDRGVIAGNQENRGVVWASPTAAPRLLPKDAVPGEGGQLYEYSGQAKGINNRGEVIGGYPREEQPGSPFNTRSIAAVVLWTRT